MTDWLPLVSLK